MLERMPQERKNGTIAFLSMEINNGCILLGYVKALRM
jgi:hypothetical protein